MVNIFYQNMGKNINFTHRYRTNLQSSVAQGVVIEQEKNEYFSLTLLPGFVLNLKRISNQGYGIYEGSLLISALHCKTLSTEMDNLLTSTWKY